VGSSHHPHCNKRGKVFADKSLRVVLQYGSDSPVGSDDMACFGVYDEDDVQGTFKDGSKLLLSLLQGIFGTVAFGNFSL